jgi:hypothetical protein
LSQLRGAQPPSTGEPKKFIKLTWADFVQLVLELTIQAYQAMRQDCVVRRDWEENTFTLLLYEDYLRPLAFDNEDPVFVECRTKVHTQAMKTGKQATIEAKEIDMKLYGSWERDYHKKYFVWEAKRVGDKRTNARYSILSPEYVHEAIYRFIRCEYAVAVSDAGMLGYVLGGEVKNIVADINQSMGRIRKNPPLSDSNRIKDAQHIHDFEHVFRSQHTRTDNTLLTLHHLFLVFDFG